MVSFIASLIVTGLLVAVIVRFAKKRKPGTPLTWGEAFVASVFMFSLMLLLYGIVPDQWLRWADGELQWRSDKIGIPTGPLPLPGERDNMLFPDGISIFDRGRIVVTAQVLRDIFATLIYIVALVGQIVGWLWWQKRGKKPAQPAIETSRYGRPLLRKAEA
jgi:hypothetical protein